MSEQMELLRTLIQQITIQDISTVTKDDQHVVELIESLQDQCPRGVISLDSKAYSSLLCSLFIASEVLELKIAGSIQ